MPPSRVLGRTLTFVVLGLLVPALAQSSIAGGGVPPPGDVPLQWSSDGSRIALVRVTPTGGVAPKQLIIVDLKTNVAEKLVTVAPGNMALSPDWEWLAAVMGEGDGIKLVVMRPDGTDRRVLSEALIYSVPSWNADGERIAFEILTRTDVKVFTVRRDGTELREVASGGRHRRGLLTAPGSRSGATGTSALSEQAEQPAET